MGVEDIYNYLRVDADTITGGQPTAEQLTAAAGEGTAAVINLAPYSAGRALADEAGVARSLGMDYFHIPVDWSNPTAGDFAAFEQALGGLGEKKCLIHCAANYRVTAFYSLYAQKHLGWTIEQAEAFRARIWAGSDYPVWEAFIADMRAGIIYSAGS